MNRYFFSVFDSAAKMFMDPFMAPTVEFAIRGFREAVNRKDHQFNKFPGDYTLFIVGEFDPERAQLIPQEPASLGVALTFVNAPTPDSLLADSFQAGDDK